MVRHTMWIGWIKNKQTSWSVNGRSLADALAHAHKDSTFVHSAGHPSVVVELEEVCGNCCGSGKIATKKLYQYKPCPDCRGNAVLNKIAFPMVESGAMHRPPIQPEQRI